MCEGVRGYARVCREGLKQPALTASQPCHSAVGRPEPIGSRGGGWERVDT